MHNDMKKIYLLLLISGLTMACLGVHADDSIAHTTNRQVPPAYRHNLQLNFGGGMHTLHYTPLNGKWNAGGGAAIDLRYQLMFTRHWGLALGVGANYLTAASVYNFEGTESNLIHPDNGRDYTSLTSFQDWKERQQILMVTIPVGIVNYEPLNDKWALSTAITFAIDLPVYNTYRATAGQYTVKGYFPSTNVTYSDLPGHGFGTYGPDDIHGENALNKVGLSAHLDFGALYTLSEHTAFYFGIYGGYGLISAADGGRLPLYAGGDEQRYTGVLQSNEIRSAHTIECGVKVGFRFGLADRFPDPEVCDDWHTLYETVIVHDTIIEPHTDTLFIQGRTDTVYQEVIRAREDTLLQQILMAAHFDSRSYSPKFDKGSEDLFRELKERMDAEPELLILVVGHTDSTGPADENMILGQQRADAFRDALVRKGINRNRIVSLSRGEEEPIAPNNTPEGRAANRRVELRMK